MRWLASLLLVLVACGESSAARVTPTDRFIFPASVAVTARPGGSALLVASGNYDLTYDGATGGTVLSVDPALAPAGSAGLAGGALRKLGEGAHVGSLVGELAVVDAATCPGWGTAGEAPVALVTTRFADQIWRLPLGLDGTLGPCQGSGCTVDVAPQFHDPFGLTLACRADGLRRSAFVSYMRTASVSGSGAIGWLAELDLDDPAAPARPIKVDTDVFFGTAGFAGMAYDGRADRLFALGQRVLTAEVFILDLAPCPPQAALATCPLPIVSVVDLYPALGGLDLQAIALSNHQDGLGRRAYVTARVYDPTLAALLRGRPSNDMGAVLLVLDLEEDLTGRPSLRVLRVVPIGLGASQVRVLPVRAPAAVGGLPRRDVVVVSSATEGVVTVYDDQEAVARTIPIDGTTGAPEAGRSPFGLAVDPTLYGTAAAPVARVYVAAVQQALVSVLEVPLDSPGQAHALRDPATGALVRIGGLK